MKLKISSKSHRKEVEWEEDAKKSRTSRVALNNRVEINPNISAITVNTKELDS